MIDGVDDTICAIATPVGYGGIGIIRLSGSASVFILRRLIDQDIDLQARYVYLKPIYRYQSDEMLDQACVIVFKSPQSYTGQDVVEIQSHSSPYVLREILLTCVSYGARLALQGEFTKRAFINGKLNLTQAESVIDLIHSDTSKSHRVALSHLKGRLYEYILSISEPIQHILEHIEATIDFPDEVGAIDRKDVLNKCHQCIQSLKQVLSYQDYGPMVLGGVNVLIVGRPNVGKSSLFNALLNQDRAIVSDIPGTTRDYIELSYDYNGMKFNLLDSAGMRQSEDPVELKGIESIHQLIEKAHILCWCLDQSEPLTEDDLRVYQQIQERDNVVICFTKHDCVHQLSIADLNSFSYVNHCFFSIYHKEACDELKLIFSQLIESNRSDLDLDLLCNIRQKTVLESILVRLIQLVKSIQESEFDDLLVIELQQILLLCSEFNGDTLNESVLDGIFSRFCVGK